MTETSGTGGDVNPAATNSSEIQKTGLGLRGKLTLLVGILLVFALFTAIFAAMQKQEAALSADLDQTALDNIDRFASAIQKYYSSRVDREIAFQHILIAKATAIGGPQGNKDKGFLDSVGSLFGVEKSKKPLPFRYHKPALPFPQKYYNPQTAQKNYKDAVETSKDLRKEMTNSLDVVGENMDRSRYRLKFYQIDNELVGTPMVPGSRGDDDKDADKDSDKDDDKDDDQKSPKGQGADSSLESKKNQAADKAGQNKANSTGEAESDAKPQEAEPESQVEYVDRALECYDSDRGFGCTRKKLKKEAPIARRLNDEFRVTSSDPRFLLVGNTAENRLLVEPVFAELGGKNLATIARLWLTLFGGYTSESGAFAGERDQDRVGFLVRESKKTYFREFIKKDRAWADEMKAITTSMTDLEDDLWEEGKDKISYRVDWFTGYKKNKDWRKQNNKFKKLLEKRRKNYIELVRKVGGIFEEEVGKPYAARQKKYRGEIGQLKKSIAKLRKQIKKARQKIKQEKLKKQKNLKKKKKKGGKGEGEDEEELESPEIAEWRSQVADLTSRLTEVRKIKNEETKQFKEIDTKVYQVFRGSGFNFDDALHVLYYMNKVEQGLSKNLLTGKMYGSAYYDLAMRRAYFVFMKNPLATAAAEREIDARSLEERAFDTLRALYLGTVQSAVNLSSQQKLREENLSWWMDFGTSVLLRALFFVFVLSTAFVRSIKEIARGTNLIGHGNLDVKFDVNTTDEIGLLAGNLNRMVKGLKERATLVGELQVAGEIQKKLLPESLPTEFEDKIELGAFYKAMTGVGGDYYDFVVLPTKGGKAPTEVLFIIADVSNHGVGPAIIMTQLRSHLRGLAPRMKSLKETVLAMNQKIYEDTPGNIFITLFVGIYNTENRSLRYIMAGHNEALVTTGDGKLKMIPPGGMPLGVVDRDMFETVIEEKKVKLNPGDFFLQYTDGLTEAMNDADEQFERERVDAYLAKNRTRPVSDILDGLVAEVESFTHKKILHEGLSELNDDIALIGFRVLE